MMRVKMLVIGGADEMSTIRLVRYDDGEHDGMTRWQRWDLWWWHDDSRTSKMVIVTMMMMMTMMTMMTRWQQNQWDGDCDDDDGFLLYLWTSCRFPSLCMSVVIKKTPQSLEATCCLLPKRPHCCGLRHFLVLVYPNESPKLSNLVYCYHWFRVSTHQAKKTIWFKMIKTGQA